MKKIITILTLFVVSALLTVSCVDEPTVSFDQTLLYGKWQAGTVYYKYVSNGTGSTWDTSDDVTEAEGQAFTWTLVEAELTHIHVLEMGGTVPKVYTVTELTATSLTYEDDFGTSYTFTKVSK